MEGWWSPRVRTSPRNLSTSRITPACCGAKSECLKQPCVLVRAEVKSVLQRAGVKFSKRRANLGDCQSLLEPIGIKYGSGYNWLDSSCFEHMWVWTWLEISNSALEKRSTMIIGHLCRKQYYQQSRWHHICSIHASLRITTQLWALNSETSEIFSNVVSDSLLHETVDFCLLPEVLQIEVRHNRHRKLGDLFQVFVEWKASHLGIISDALDSGAGVDTVLQAIYLTAQPRHVQLSQWLTNKLAATESCD